MSKPWWKVRYLGTGRVLNSEQVPVKLLPNIEHVDIANGHKFNINDIEIEAGPVRVDLRTGTIWHDDKVIARVPDFDRVILHKRRFAAQGGATYDHTHIGLVNINGEGYQARITHNDQLFIEPHVVGVMRV
jgi:hypothetical protein